ncbi:MNIO family bufferin maturase [Aminobacter carboxidus]|uniref:UPF0276 protein IHE39_15900 n=1 Tax=Aminobacter carboxidus TaxID=376165 RepID=A0ABR9GQ22_9HYPH|nr:DUF692 domain-containing protein [Aminobacter carboxidus]MBE1205780.1 DUF692 domain-containing protein [Aminobacter carboxidus]
MNTGTQSGEALPARAGLGLKPEHIDEIIATEPDVGFFEVHAENYMGDGGAPHRALTAITSRYPLSLHGVGLSIGAERPLDKAHLARLKALVERYRPQSFSEHLAWSTHESGFLNDLLPLPYTKATLERVSAHVDAVQQTVGARMLLENPSTYILFEDSVIDEIDFLEAIAENTGCGLLLDVNNVMVSAVNHRLDAFAYIDRFPVERVGEIHLAGYDETVDGAGDRLLIDAHNSTVADDVFALYRHTLGRTGPVPTLIEWDNDVPAFPVLLAEATHANQMLDAAPHWRDVRVARRA